MWAHYPITETALRSSGSIHLPPPCDFLVGLSARSFMMGIGQGAWDAMSGKQAVFAASAAR